MSEERWVQVVTSAPPEYDYGWTRPICDNIGIMFSFVATEADKVLRLVEVFGESRVQHQIARYRSGLYTAMLESEYRRDLTTYAESYISAPDLTQWYHRGSFDFQAVIDWEPVQAVIHLTDAIERIQNYHNVTLESPDGGLTYHLTVKGTVDRFEVIKAELRAAYREAELMVKKSDEPLDPNAVDLFERRLARGEEMLEAPPTQEKNDDLSGNRVGEDPGQ